MMGRHFCLYRLYPPIQHQFCIQPLHHTTTEQEQPSNELNTHSYPFQCSTYGALTSHMHVHCRFTYLPCPSPILFLSIPPPVYYSLPQTAERCDTYHGGLTSVNKAGPVLSILYAEYCMYSMHQVRARGYIPCSTVVGSGTPSTLRSLHSTLLPLPHSFTAAVRAWYTRSG